IPRTKDHPITRGPEGNAKCLHPDSLLAGHCQSSATLLAGPPAARIFVSATTGVGEVMRWWLSGWFESQNVCRRETFGSLSDTFLQQLVSQPKSFLYPAHNNEPVDNVSSGSPRQLRASSFPAQREIPTDFTGTPS